MDHIFTRHIDDIEAVVEAYRALGIRAYIAPMLTDDKENYVNYIPLVHDANERNKKGGCDCGGMGDGGKMRVGKGGADPELTKWALDLWEEAVQKFHRPEEGIEIVIGPVTAYCECVAGYRWSILFVSILVDSLVCCFRCDLTSCFDRAMERGCRTSQKVQPLRPHSSFGNQSPSTPS